MIVAAHDPTTMVRPMMTTADMSLRYYPVFEPISRRFAENQAMFEDAFARAWFKLTHRDMGPRARYLGAEVPAEELIWQDAVPKATYPSIDEADIALLKERLLVCGLTSAQLIKTAWASASSFRGSDKRGGANGARIRLDPQKSWKVNEPEQLQVALSAISSVQAAFNQAHAGGKQVSLADLIVLGGVAAIEKAAKDAGYDVPVPFSPGRTDATEAQTDAASFCVLEPKADAFRNYQKEKFAVMPETLMIDRAQLLTLTAPEMTVLLGGLRVLGANYGNMPHGVFTKRPGLLTNDFFVNILDMRTQWKPLTPESDVFEGVDRASGARKWTATRVDLVFGANAQLRALCEVYGAADAEEKFVRDFILAWTKVMEADRFDLK